MRFFKMSNQVFDYQLSPNGFKVYCLLVSRKNCLNAVCISYQTIAESCGIDTKTVCRAIKELVSKDLINKDRRFNIRGYAKNKYIVKSFPGGWFKIEYRILNAKMPASDFMVYSYIRKCMGAKSHEAFPSFSSIAQNTGISRSRVAVAIRYLREHTYLNRVNRRYKRTMAYRQNRYLLFRLQPKKKEARSSKRTSFTELIIKKSYFLIHIIKRMVKNVKLFFKSQGSPEIP